MTSTANCTATSTPVVANGMDATMKTLLASFLHNPALLDKFNIPRFKLRLATIQAWGVQAGQHLLDIGCGQGESSVALAAVVGDGGHVTGLDPAPLDYGHPFTVRDAQQHIQQSVLGPRVSFYPVDTVSFLAEQRRPTDRPIDGAVLCQSLFYFPNEAEVKSLFTTLHTARISPLYVAEWSYTPSHEAQRAHILATKVQRLFYRYKPQGQPGLREQNVRAGVDQQVILRAAKAVGYRVCNEALITPEEDMLEGQFEVGYVLGDVFKQRVEDAALSQEQQAEISSAVQELRLELDNKVYSDGTGVKAMDVWAAVFELGE